MMEFLIDPPSKYPDIFPALFSIFGALNLVAVYVISVYYQLSLPDAVETTLIGLKAE